VAELTVLWAVFNKYGIWGAAEEPENVRPSRMIIFEGG
jgi:hypothetical protein